MASTPRAALPPEKEAPRRSGRTERGTTNFISNSATADSTLAHRLQVLACRYGVIGAHAAVLASIAWEAVQ